MSHFWCQEIGGEIKSSTSSTSSRFLFVIDWKIGQKTTSVNNVKKALFSLTKDLASLSVCARPVYWFRF